MLQVLFLQRHDACCNTGSDLIIDFCIVLQNIDNLFPCLFRDIQISASSSHRTGKLTVTVRGQEYDWLLVFRTIYRSKLRNIDSVTFKIFIKHIFCFFGRLINLINQQELPAGTVDCLQDRARDEEFFTVKIDIAGNLSNCAVHIHILNLFINLWFYCFQCQQLALVIVIIQDVVFCQAVIHLQS